MKAHKFRAAFTATISNEDGADKELKLLIHHCGIWSDGEIYCIYDEFLLEADTQLSKEDMTALEMILDNGALDISEDCLLLDGAKLQEYIGLKDKTGKELCEGDYVRLVAERSWLGVIRWCERCAAWCADFGDWKAFFDVWNGEDLVVIGNTHQHHFRVGEEK